MPRSKVTGSSCLVYWTVSTTVVPSHPYKAGIPVPDSCFRGYADRAGIASTSFLVASPPLPRECCMEGSPPDGSSGFPLLWGGPGACPSSRRPGCGKGEFAAAPPTLVRRRADVRESVIHTDAVRLLYTPWTFRHLRQAQRPPGRARACPGHDPRGKGPNHRIETRFERHSA